MLKAFVFSFVVTFAVGPSVPLFCAAWCDPDVAEASGCHHGGNQGRARISGDGSCLDPVLGVAVVTREDLRRGGGHAVDGVPVPATVLVMISADATGLAARSGPPSPFHVSRAATPLRI